MKRNVQNTKFQTPKTNKGITLVALVITIIVLLILAGVAINMAINSDGLFGKANEATDKWNESVREESQTIDNLLAELGVINWEKAMAEAVAPESQDEVRNEGVIGIGTDGKPVDMDLWEYAIIDGVCYLNSLNSITAMNNSDWSNVLCGYKGDTTAESIIGLVPQLISTDGGKTYTEVTRMDYTFKNLDKIKNMPKLPSNVKSCMGTFEGCTSLKNLTELPQTVENITSMFLNCVSIVVSPEIPSNVIKMEYTFRNCSNLELISEIESNVLTDMKETFSGCNKIKTSPILPDSVTDMRNTFYGCTSLQTILNIPNNVTNMDGTFNGCTSLTEVGKIPNSVTNMRQTFQNCTSLENSPEIPNAVENMHGTFFQCNKLINGPSKIPSSVTNMFQTFSGCYKLEGTIEINATIDESIVFEYNGVQYTGYNQTFFSNACTAGTGLTILKTSTCPKEILVKMVDNNAKITIEE